MNIIYTDTEVKNVFNFNFHKLRTEQGQIVHRSEAIEKLGKNEKGKQTETINYGY